MSKKEKDIELIPDSGVASGWRVKHGNSVGTGPSNYPKVGFAKDSGPHLVVFTLPKTETVSFNANDPMWIQKTDPANPSSPTQSGMDPQFSDWAIFDGGKTLVLLDKNTEKGTYAYRVKADGYTPVLDPIVDNGGGVGVIDPPGFAPGGGYSQSEYITAAVVALLVGFLIGYFVHKLFFNPKPLDR